MSRSYNRTPNDLRPLVIEPGFYDYADGSCLIKMGNTHVICAATIDEQAPPHLRGSGTGWVTGEYSMLPKSSPQRIRRERDKVGGRTQEIQRLIGRALRSVVDMKALGERSITIDCDVIRADGGTRVASITGGFIALVMAVRKLGANGKISQTKDFPVKDFLSAVSVGLYKGNAILDLDYVEDSVAETDMNLVVTGAGKLVEIQGTAEKEPFTDEQFQSLLVLGKQGCQMLIQKQKEILGNLNWK